MQREAQFGKDRVSLNYKKFGVGKFLILGILFVDIGDVFQIYDFRKL